MFGQEVPKSTKEERREMREDTKSLEGCFKLGIGNSLDKMLDVVQGRYHTPSLPDEPDKITAPIQGPMSRRAKVSARNDEDDEEDTEERPSRRSPSVSKYAEVINELERFRFASDEDKRNKQMVAVAKAVRSALQDFVPTEVFNNTKNAFGDYVYKGFKINGGVKVQFLFGKQKIAVSARGAFFGDEVICVGNSDGKVKASVQRLTGSGDDLEDVSTDFAISLENV